MEIIANDQGNRTTPSYVAFTDTERLIGDPAKNQVLHFTLPAIDTFGDICNLMWGYVERMSATNNPYTRDFVEVDNEGKLTTFVPYTRNEDSFC